MRRLRWPVVLLATLGLIASACGGDDDDGDVAVEDTEEEATTTAVEQVDCTLPEAVDVYFLLGKARESTDPNAVPDFQDGWEMAVAEINDAGGVCGHPIEWDGPVTVAAFGEEAKTDYQRAIDAQPDVIIGFSSSSALDAAAELVKSANIPTLHFTTNPKAKSGGPSASPNLLGMRVANDDGARIAAEYAMNELGACNIGLLHFDLAFGQEGAEVQEQAIEEGGCEVHADRAHAFNATDLTNEVLAMDGADAVLDWGTPNTIVLAVNTFLQQGLVDIPHVTPGSSGFSSFYQNVDEAGLDNVLGVVDCNPLDEEEWADRFESEYGYPPSYAAAQTYDTAFMIKKVLEEEETLDPAAINEALANVAYDGICGQYEAANGFAATETTIIRFEDGLPVTEETVPVS